MLSPHDIIAAKMIVQLGHATPDAIRAELRAIDKGETAGRDLLNRFADQGKLPPKIVETLRHRVALYEHVRGEATYMRLLERHAQVGKHTVAKLLNEIERTAFRRRLGDVLVQEAKVTKEQDKYLDQKQREALTVEDQRIMERYRAENFEGAARPLIPGSRLDPEDFKISKLFRGKETRALVDQAELEALRAEAVASQQKTAPWDPNSPTHAGQAPAATKPGTAGGDKKTASAANPEVVAKGLDRVRGMQRIGEYAVIEVLGVGGMGAVFLGQRDGTGEYAAIKVMLDIAATKEERGRFEREITLTQRVKHPNVIGIIEAGSTPDGLTFLVVPTLVGKELRSLLDSQAGKGLPLDLACKVFEEMCEGLAACHKNRIVHRDLKPENVMLLGKERTVKIMDFGLAKLDDEADKESSSAMFRTTGGEVVGSPAYIAPESITRDPIDARTDIYSLGIMFFEMLTGRLPIESESVSGFLTQHLVAPPSSLAEVRPARKWPEELEALLQRMMAKTRDERPASCTAILEEFRTTAKPKLFAMDEAEKVPAEVAAPPPPPVSEKDHGVKGLLGRLLGRGR